MKKLLLGLFLVLGFSTNSIEAKKHVIERTFTNLAYASYIDCIRGPHPGYSQTKSLNYGRFRSWLLLELKIDMSDWRIKSVDVQVTDIQKKYVWDRGAENTYLTSVTAIITIDMID